MSNSSRLFFALWPDEIARNKAFVIAQRAKEKCAGRIIKPHSLHMTLVFLGETLNVHRPDIEAIGCNVAAKQFDLTLDKIGYWKQGIFWLGVKELPSELTELVTFLRQSLKKLVFSLMKSRSFRT